MTLPSGDKAWRDMASDSHHDSEPMLCRIRSRQWGPQHSMKSRAISAARARVFSTVVDTRFYSPSELIMIGEKGRRLLPASVRPRLQECVLLYGGQSGVAR